MRRRHEAWALGGLVLAAFALRGFHLDWGLPQVFEEATPVREAIEFWGKPGRSLDLNPHFFRYPSLSFYINFWVQAIAYLWFSLSGSVASLNDFRQLLAEGLDRAVLWGRWAQAAAGALVIVPVYALGRRVAGKLAGWTAAILTALVPMAVVESRLVAPDIYLALFTAVALLAAVRVAERGDRADYLWCGLSIGLAAASKYPGALLAAGLLVAHVVRVRERHEGPTGVLLSGLLWQGLFVAVVTFAAATPYVFLDASTAAADIAFERRHMALGHFGREEGRAWLFYLRTALGGGWTAPVTVAGVLGLAALLARRATRGRALPLVVFATLVVLIMGSWRMAAPRYILPVLPVIVVGAGAAAAFIAGAIRGGTRARTGASALLVVALATWPATGAYRAVAGHGYEDSRVAAARWIDAHLPEGSTLLVERYGPELDTARMNVLTMPFHAITPHVYDPAYSPPLYATFDAVVLSSEVYGRYLADTREYPAQAAFYAAMDRAFHEAARFTSGEYLGPTIRVLLPRPGAAMRDLSNIPPDFFASLRGNSRMAEHFSALGTVLVRQKKTELGLRMLREAVDVDPASARAWSNLGVMSLELGHSQEALAALRRARTLDPENAALAFNLGRAYQRMGEASQAVDAFQEAVARDPALEGAYLGLARSLVELDRYASARAVLGEFLRRFPRSADRARAEQVLAELSKMGPGRP